MPVDDASQDHKGWYSRNYLPHFDQPGLVQGITFRLFDSMPVERRLEWEGLAKIKDPALRHQRIEAYINAGCGSCFLRDPRVASIVQDGLLFFDGERYRLLAWVIMPNHIHIVAEMVSGHPLAQVLHSWKSYTALQANQVLGRTGPFWHREYYDRFVRNDEHLEKALNYVHDNPVKAELVKHPEDWPFSSARYYAEGKLPPEEVP